ncbi:MAG: class I SAM-dependent methyltransferase [Pseudomonadota bacterium]
MPGYQVKFETLFIGDTSLKIRSLKDQLQYADPDGSCERAGISSATWPLFGLVWPSSLILAETMRVHAIDGLKVLELGCGLGLASLIASQRGADITASDYHPLAASFLKENIALNDFLPIKYERGNWEKLDSVTGKFDLIIGSDLLYEPNHPHMLSEFIHYHSEKTVKVIIVDPNRRQQSQFTQKMLKLGYSLTIEMVKNSWAKALNYKGKVLSYSRG